ncbi:hypothetical protein Bxe_A1504 [Paraburkholderia xenovorans LB400]|uniref:Uncharacterized protein n=1 Tax=Paraburkholderia xenovorans (strain LB400) TaxID=266265 RepID=Q13WT9_PARXL|nr:hypothetical protein Bxe_A1504 [Paraburkholderia xenovorans LB400]
MGCSMRCRDSVEDRTRGQAKPAKTKPATKPATKPTSARAYQRVDVQHIHPSQRSGLPPRSVLDGVSRGRTKRRWASIGRGAQRRARSSRYCGNA